MQKVTYPGNPKAKHLLHFNSVVKAGTGTSWRAPGLGAATLAAGSPSDGVQGSALPLLGTAALQAWLAQITGLAAGTAAVGSRQALDRAEDEKLKGGEMGTMQKAHSPRSKHSCTALRPPHGTSPVCAVGEFPSRWMGHHAQRWATPPRPLLHILSMGMVR